MRMSIETRKKKNLKSDLGGNLTLLSYHGGYTIPITLFTPAV